jgi:hypothetical protein
MGDRFLEMDTVTLLLSLANVGVNVEESFGVPYCSQKAFNFQVVTFRNSYMSYNVLYVLKLLEVQEV